MTEEQLNKQTEQQEMKVSADKPPENKRRRLIKGAVAVPVIMTLHSGAALARSSNMVGAVDVSQAKTIDGVDGKQIVCVKGAEDLGNDQHDLGDPVAATAELEEYIQRGQNEAESLRLQGESCNGAQGIMISATAWTSIGPKLGSPYL